MLVFEGGEAGLRCSLSFRFKKGLHDVEGPMTQGFACSRASRLTLQ